MKFDAYRAESAADSTSFGITNAKPKKMQNNQKIDFAWGSLNLWRLLIKAPSGHTKKNNIDANFNLGFVFTCLLYLKSSIRFYS